MNELNNPGPLFYFALPRLIALFRGGDPGRSENNATEARIAGLAVYLISFLFLAGFVPAGLRAWQSVTVFAGLVFFVWFFWLLLLYLNSLIIRLLRLGGIFRGIPTRRAQSILAGFSTTAMAWSVFQHGSWKGEIGAIWLCAVTLNLVAALVLALHHGTRAQEK